MKRLVSCENHYGVLQSLSSIFQATTIVRSSPEPDFDFEKGDVLLLGGGEDISPTIYKQKPSRYCHAGMPSRRDIFELAMIKKAVKAKIPMIGICRGAQLICAYTGGTLIQHVTGHGRDHKMTTKEGTVLSVSSAHHQMMNPFGTKHDLIAWATEKQSHCYLSEREKEIEMSVEPEIIYFPAVKGLAVQWHPEFMNERDEAVIYLKNLIQETFKE
jgi:putative glutamine amidotransferase